VKKTKQTHQLLARVLAQVLFVSGLLLATSLMAGPLQQSELASIGFQEHHVGKVILVQLVTPNLPLAKRFYGGLFGWQFRDLKLEGEDYAEASMNGQLVAGLIHKPFPINETRQSSWLSFIAVHDVDSIQKLATALGAKTLLEPHTIANRGREAVFLDPQGAVFGVLGSTSGDPPDELADPGEWIWSSLSTTDPELIAGFYQTLFKYEVFDLPSDQGVKHLILTSDGYARTSVNSLPTSRLNTRAHWLNYVRVVDVDAMSAKTVSLGGHVLVEPRVDRHGGKVAIVSDPLGAPFGLFEWPETQDQGAAQ
jgi:predicted enzyme related to lactoylglutathione lyase